MNHLSTWFVLAVAVVIVASACCAAEEAFSEQAVREAAVRLAAKQRAAATQPNPEEIIRDLRKTVEELTKKIAALQVENVALKRKLEQAVTPLDSTSIGELNPVGMTVAEAVAKIGAEKAYLLGGDEQGQQYRIPAPSISRTSALTFVVTVRNGKIASFSKEVTRIVPARAVFTQ